MVMGYQAARVSDGRHLQESRTKVAVGIDAVPIGGKRDIHVVWLYGCRGRLDEAEQIFVREVICCTPSFEST